MQGKITLLDVDKETASFLGKHLPSDLHLEESKTPDDLLERLQNNAVSTDVAILGLAVREPVSVAQRFYFLQKDIPILILCPPGQYKQLKQGLQFSPFLGSDVQPWSISEVDALPAILEFTVAKARQHKRYVATINAAQSDLRKMRVPKPTWRNYLDRLMDYAPIGILTLDQQMIIKNINRQAGIILEIGEREAVGISFTQFLKQSDKQDLSKLTAQNTLQEKHPAAKRLDITGMKGKTQCVEITVAPVVEYSGELSSMIILQDINDRVKAELERQNALEQLKHYTEELKRSNSELEQFAYVASHDLQEPLRAVSGSMELFQKRYKGQVDERADEYIKHAVEGSKRMQKLIDDLLMFSRIGRGGGKFVEVSMEESLKNSLENLSVSIKDKAAQITYDPLPKVVADQSQMILLFQNLIGNGLKFSKPDTIPQIHIGIEKSTNKKVFFVRDNGIGIKEEFFERLFTIFQRLHTRDEYPGTGIGLSVCKKIIERHNGRIWVKSVWRQGSTFYFTIPPVK